MSLAVKPHSVKKSSDGFLIAKHVVSDMQLLRVNALLMAL